MASASKNGPSEGVEFIYEEDGSITAKDIETGLARGGETKAKALANLAEVLALEGGEGTQISDPDEFLRNLDIDPEKQVDGEPPWE